MVDNRKCKWYFADTGIIWESANGPTDIGHMSDSHLGNTVALLRRKQEAVKLIYPSGEPETSKMLKAMLEECARRGEIRRMYPLIVADKGKKLRDALDGILSDAMVEVVIAVRKGGELPEAGQRRGENSERQSQEAPGYFDGEDYYY